MVDLTGVLAPKEGRPIEIITKELLEAKVAGGRAILTIGQRLIEAKAVLSRGEWLPWLEDQVDFSERSAQNFMALAQEYASNPQALADLGATKALQLLALPQAEREDFISHPHQIGGEEKMVSDMSTRELKRELAAAKQAKQTAQELADGLRDQLEGTRAELAELRAKPVDVAVEVDQEAIDKAKAEAVAEMSQRLTEANEARRAAENEMLKAQRELKESDAELDAIKAKQAGAAVAADKELAQFDSWFTLAQELVNKMVGVRALYRSRGDEATAAKLGKALQALGEAVGRAGR